MDSNVDKQATQKYNVLYVIIITVFVSNRLCNSCLAFYTDYTGCKSGCQAEGKMVN